MSRILVRLGVTLAAVALLLFSLLPSAGAHTTEQPYL